MSEDEKIEQVSAFRQAFEETYNYNFVDGIWVNGDGNSNVAQSKSSSSFLTLLALSALDNAYDLVKALGDSNPVEGGYKLFGALSVTEENGFNGEAIEYIIHETLSDMRL